MPKATFRLLMASLAGIAVFIGTLFLLDTPARIKAGEHAQIAIQSLDAMRPPMLAIAKAGETSTKTADIATFDRSATELKNRVRQYLESSRYNEELHNRVRQFSQVIDDWLRNERALLEYRNNLAAAENSLEILQQLKARHSAAIDEFLNAMEVLALGEHPIHQDIGRGRQASQRLQILAALLVLYLLSLIVIYQRIAKTTLLKSFHEVQEARRDLAQREQYLALTLDSIGDAVIATDVQGRVTRMNPVAEQLTGWPEKEAVRLPLKQVFHIVNAMTRVPVADPVEKVLQSGEIVGLANHTILISRRGEERQIADSGAPIRDDNGRILGVILVFRDVTDEYRMQAEIRAHRDELEQRVSLRTQELEQSNKELESFSYAVSHDLRAPLRSINGFSEALLEDNSDQLDDTGKDYLRRISSAARHMGELIDAMLVLSRVTRKDIRHTDTDLSKAANEIAEELGKQDPSRDVEWRISENLHAEGDIDLMHIVLENLLGNAWKYSSKNTGRSCIEFGAMEQDGEKVFFVRDNGCGFNTGYSEKLFAAFQRLHGKEYEGTGIGLATVQRIIQRHKGRVWADSSKGNGSTFYFTLG